MLIIFNKKKIYSYLIALTTVIALFVISFAINKVPKETIQTSTNMEIENNQNKMMENSE